MGTTKTTFCRICEPACPMKAEIGDDGQIKKLRPNTDHPMGGIPCNKGLSFLDIHQDPDRLNWPMKRLNSRHEPSKFEPMTWDDALPEIAERIHALQAKYGNNSLAFYVGNPPSFDVRGGNVVYYMAPSLGTKTIFSAGTQDCNNKVFTTAAMYGAMAFIVPDLPKTNYFLCIGANPRASHWTWVSVPQDGGQILKDIKNRGGKVTFVNPRRIEASTPETGDTLRIKPDTDVYFLAAISHEIYKRGGFNEANLAKYGKKVDQYKAYIEKWPASRVARVCGLSEQDIITVAEDIIAADGAAVYMSTGINQGRNGNIACWLTEMINFATGNLGREGGTYKPTGYHEPAATPLFSGEYEGTPDGTLPVNFLGALPAVLMPEMIDNGSVKGLVCIGGNPLMTMSGERQLLDSYKKLEFILSIDILPNATSELADYMLPATDFLEREDTTSFPMNTGCSLIPMVQYTDAMVEPAHERKTDWWIAASLLKALGKPSPLDDDDHQEGFKLINSFIEKFDLSVEKLKDLPHHTAFIDEKPKDSVYDRQIVHPDKKIDCYPDVFTEHDLYNRCEQIFKQLEAEPEDTLKIISMRTTHMHNSWLNNSPKLRKGIFSDNCLRISPEDAQKRSLFDGDWVRVFTEHGEMKCRIDVRDDMREGTVAMTHGYGQNDAHALKISSSKAGVNMNKILPIGSGAYEPLSYMSWMCGVPVEVEKIPDSA